jgi:hypothetical protein
LREQVRAVVAGNRPRKLRKIKATCCGNAGRLASDSLSVPVFWFAEPKSTYFFGHYHVHKLIEKYRRKGNVQPAIGSPGPLNRSRRDGPALQAAISD